MTLAEELAFQLVKAGAEVVAAAARLRESGDIAVTCNFLAVAQERIALLNEAATALEAGNGTECRLILDHLALQRPPDFE